MKNKKIAILIPCYNEDKTIAKVVSDFKKELSNSDVYVYDNNSTDNTYSEALKAGAIVRSVKEKGKGNVLRNMFIDIDSDLYVIVDGDNTYPAENINDMLEVMLKSKADMIVGDRHSNGSYKKENERPMHNFGNKIVAVLINKIYSTKLKDIMSGYRILSKDFVSLLPIMSNGFEVETEMTMHALDKMFKIEEVPITYRDRPEGSYSKLNTYTDGIKVLKTIVTLFKDYKPMKFFFFLFIFFFSLSLLIGIPVISEFFRTSQIEKIPSAILSSGLMILSFISIFSGFILDTLSKQNASEYLQKRLILKRNRSE